MTDLKIKYTGDVARNYESKRIRSWKWKFEQRAVSDFLNQIKPETVLDAPVGTGRFLSVYEKLGIKATGLDISEAMLAQAKVKAGGNFILGDLLKFEPSIKFDAVVCIRFLNWLDWSGMHRAMAKIQSLTGEYVIISLTTAEKEPIARGNRSFIPAQNQIESLVGGFSIVDQRMRQTDELTSRILLLKKL